MAACVKTVKEVRRMGWNCQLPIVALFSWCGGVKIEMEGEEKKNMQALSAHYHGTWDLLKDFHPAISPPLRSNQYGSKR